jgi:integrase
VLDVANVRRAFRRITKAAGLNPADWTPRELRHSFVSLLSDGGVSLKDIADLCGHSGTRSPRRCTAISSGPSCARALRP